MAKEDRAEDGASVYWMVLGAPLAFLLSFMIFSQWSVSVPKLALLLQDLRTADSAEGPVDDQLWLSGEHTSVTEIEDYSWAKSPLVESQGEGSLLSRLPRAQIQVSCGDDWEFVAVEFSRTPETVGAQAIGGGFDRVLANVEWDGRQETIEFLQERGSKTMSFADGQAAISRLIVAKIMRLSLRQSGEKVTRFEFPLTGSSAAINGMRSSCR